VELAEPGDGFGGCHARPDALPRRMRISGGRAKGIPLKVPSGLQVRPATDGMRQALFSSLGERVVGAYFLDLFAGSGAYGLEALSRGAAGGVWIERHAGTVRCLRANLAAVCRSCGREESGLEVIEGDATRVPWPVDRPAPDLIFVDPPYDRIAEVAEPVCAAVKTLLGGKTDVLLALEAPGELKLEPAGWEIVKRLGKGRHQPSITVFRCVGGSPE